MKLTFAEIQTNQDTFGAMLKQQKEALPKKDVTRLELKPTLLKIITSDHTWVFNTNTNSSCLWPTTIWVTN